MSDRPTAPTLCIIVSEHLTNHYAGPLVRGATYAAAALGAQLVIYTQQDIRLSRRTLTLRDLPLLPRRVDGYLLPGLVDDEVVSLANAGAIAPIIASRRETRVLELGGLPLGTPLAHLPPYDELTIRLAPGDVLVLSTDGIVEATNIRGELYGFDRFVAAIAGGPLGSAEALLAHLFADVRAFVGEAEMHDDMTIVVARYRGDSNATLEL
ncbi:MAG TPA: PP2C family protein-serine/threonine phosphatase [Roseiflexaceae bacterium]